MNGNNFTIKSQEALQQAQLLAQEKGHQQVENEHLFKAISMVDEHVLPFLLKKLAVNEELILRILDKELDSFPQVSGGEMMFSQKAAKTINQSAIIAKNMKDEFVAIEHLILAIFESKSKIAQVLKDHTVTEKGLRSAIDDIKGPRYLLSLPRKPIIRLKNMPAI